MSTPLVQQVSQPQQTFFYRLEPGDGTRYTFSLTPLEAEAEKMLTGANPFEDKWFMLCIYMTGTQLAHPVSSSMLADDLKYVRGYLTGKTKCYDKYTVTAVLLAVRVLSLNLANLSGAAEAMLETPQLLSS